MAPTNMDAQRFIDRLERVLQDCDRQSGVKAPKVIIKAIAPAGAKIGTAVTFEPELADAVLASFTIDEVKRTVADWESEVGLWVENVATVWTAEATPRRVFDCLFRVPY